MQRWKKICSVVMVSAFLILGLELLAAQLEAPTEETLLPTPDSESATYLDGASRLPKAKNTITLPPLKGVGWAQPQRSHAAGPVALLPLGTQPQAHFPHLAGSGLGL